MRDSAVGGAVVDNWLETAGRWTAARTTRRSFFARVGRFGIALAGGPALATLLADAAEARVCGQSGVSPQCPTFDCDDGVWGWCWYATGCCTEGMLKKICDCCVANWPNVHGYCPSGTNVKCIVESCGSDPRVQRAEVARLAVDDPAEIEAHLRLRRFPVGAPTVVITDVEWTSAGAIAAPLGAIVGGPVLSVPRAGLQADTMAALEALGATTVRIVGPDLPDSLDADLQARGLSVERIGATPDAAVLSGEVAAWVEANFGPRDVVCVAEHGVSLAVAPAAAALAHVLVQPLIFGADTRVAGGGVLLVGPELLARQADLPNARVVGGATPAEVSAELASLAGAPTTSAGWVVLAPADARFLLALAGAHAPLLLHDAGQLGQPARDFLHRRSAEVNRVEVVGVAAGLDARGIYEVQSLLNGFEVHRLVGTAGQGLPVYEQPPLERVLGKARSGSDGAPPRPAAPRSRGRSPRRLARARSRSTRRRRRAP